MRIMIEVPDRVLKDLLVTAVESGSSAYWAGFTEVSRDGNLDILFVKVADEDNGATYDVTPQNIGEGLQRLATRMSQETLSESWMLKQDAASRHFTDAITENGDSTTADVVLQMACFGEVLYG
jgi:hypothetical protein